ncbi:MAG: hypothetical protein IPF87_02075 [Gemmatimonadetes bacterium]|jgi:hypothetical protein|nr:hypothetical protein [Gemmatimonadota bacterium]HNV76350.1 hypothetical protein [Gemmatimonadaceae bacterium]MBK6454862.1 hypothetical protein [Gemmatimonadota bacterium]MBK6841053.1 hypothetical protein [Gemmatimonadota bacterium]MBK8056517.1 hypothetical protein [Gemmatimonadota bacterium]
MDQSEFILAMTAILTGGGITVTLIVSVLRYLSSKREPSALGSGQLGQLDDRLARMEQAIDSMAIEVERISEGQRFTARLLAERPAERPVERLAQRPAEGAAERLTERSSGR